MSSVNLSTSVDPREQRGVRIAPTFDLRKRGIDWLVPSQSGIGNYCVRMVESHPTSCYPDQQPWRYKYKHVCAVQLSLHHEERPDGKTVVIGAVCTTCKHNWSACYKPQPHGTERVAIAEVSAGKGCLQHGTLWVVVAAGAVSYTSFKSDTTGEGPNLWHKV